MASFLHAKSDRDASMTTTSVLQRRWSSGFPISELVFWSFAVLVLFVFPNNLSLAASIAIMALFAVSLDLVLGFAGIVTLGHALYFGAGAYVSAWVSLAGWNEPLSGLLLCGLATTLLALAVGCVILRLSGLPLIMVTMVIGLVGYEAANKATDWTGGDNGLSGMSISPLLGKFDWSVYGKVEYIYTLVILFVGFQLSKRLVHSPFGLALRGIRENPLRMSLLGSPVRGRLLRVYAFSAFLAGVAGALNTHTTQFVGLDVLSMNTSVNVLVMLVVGGSGVLSGAIIGSIVYMVIHQFASEWNPYHWMFIIGTLLMFVVRMGSGGISGSFPILVRKLRGVRQ